MCDSINQVKNRMSEKGSTMKKSILYVLGLVIFHLVCKPNSSPGYSDPIWRDESLKIAIDICSKLDDCSKNFIPQLPEQLQKGTKERLGSLNCIEKHKKSHIYLLKVPEIESAKSAFRECRDYLIHLSCDEVTSGKMNLNEKCLLVSKLQKQGI